MKIMPKNKKEKKLEKELQSEILQSNKRKY